MASELFVALPRATVTGSTFFGQNCTHPAAHDLALMRVAGRAHEFGECVALSRLTLPQARHTNTVLGLQTPGSWGLLGGVNEHRVAVGQTTIRTRLPAAQPGLTGCELVRLVLERGQSARQAVDCLTDLVTRHGQGEQGLDHSFLVADGREAWVVETAGTHWAVQEIGAVRAVNEVCLLRQDWNRIGHGLAEVAIERGWWPQDGTKMNFAEVVAPDSASQAAALGRWGRSTLLLEQQNGNLDESFFRSLLSRRLDHDADAAVVQASLYVETLAPEQPALAWFSLAVPSQSLYFPLFLDADLPAAFQANGSLSQRSLQLATLGDDAALEEGLAVLQSRFEQQVQETLPEATTLKQQHAADAYQRLLGSCMQANLERFEEFCSTQGQIASPRLAQAARTVGGLVRS